MRPNATRPSRPPCVRPDAALGPAAPPQPTPSERKTEHEEKHEGYYRLERATGAFSRSLTLPEGIDPESVRATFDNGVLEVRIPKPVQAQPRRVQIGVAGAEPKTIDADAPATTRSE